MIEENVNQVSSFVKENVSKRQFAELDAAISSADEAKAEKVKSVKVKKPLITTLLSAFFGLFGGGSFYLGQIKRGVAKLVFNIVVPVLVVCIFLVCVAPNYQRYADQGTAYGDVLDELTSDNITAYSNYNSSYSALVTALSGSGVSIDSQLGVFSDAYSYFSGVELEDSSADSSDSEQTEEREQEEDEPADVDVARTFNVLYPLLTDFYDDYVVSISEGGTALTSEVLYAIAGVIYAAENDIYELIADALSPVASEALSAVDELLAAMNATAVESGEGVTLAERVSTLRAAINEAYEYLDASDEESADYEYAVSLKDFLGYLVLEDDGTFSEENAEAITVNSATVKSAIGYAYDVAEAGYKEYIDNYIAVTYTDFDSFIDYVTTGESGGDSDALTYGDVYDGAETLISWLLSNYQLPDLPDEGAEDYAEVKAEYDQIKLYRDNINTLWQNFCLFDDFVSLSGYFRDMNITVPDVTSVDELVEYLKTFAEYEYSRASESILNMLNEISAYVSDEGFLSEIEKFEAFGAFTSSQVSSSASAASSFLEVVNLMLTDDLDDLKALQSSIDSLTEQLNEMSSSDEGYEELYNQRAELNAKLAAMSVLSGDYTYISDSLYGAIKDFADDVQNMYAASTDYYRNLEGYTDEDDENSIVGLMNTTVATAGGKAVTVESFITDFTKMVEDVADAVSNLTDDSADSTYVLNKDNQNVHVTIFEYIEYYVADLNSIIATGLSAWQADANDILAATEENDGLLIGEEIDKKLYNDLDLIGRMEAVAGYLNTAITDDDYDVISQNVANAYTTVYNFSSEIDSKVSDWQFTHDLVYMFFLIIVIIDAVVIAAYWVGEVFRDREKCFNMNYKNIKNALGC